MHLQYPNYSGTLATGGGLVFLGLLDGTVAAFDDTTLEQLWKINVGSGFSAPPMTFEVNGRQYIAIASGPSVSAKAKLVNTPELKDQRQRDRALRLSGSERTGDDRGSGPFRSPTCAATTAGGPQVAGGAAEAHGHLPLSSIPCGAGRLG